MRQTVRGSSGQDSGRLRPLRPAVGKTHGSTCQCVWKMKPLYPEVSERAQKRCEYCHAPAEAFNFPFDIEHIKPVSAGGSDNLDNLALACRSCNVFKSSRQQAPDPETNKITPLFHPRNHNWDEHFQVDSEYLQVMGQTAIGRATVAILQINSAEQQFARRQWKRLGLFP